MLTSKIHTNLHPSPNRALRLEDREVVRRTGRWSMTPVVFVPRVLCALGALPSVIHSAIPFLKSVRGLAFETYLAIEARAGRESGRFEPQLNGFYNKGGFAEKYSKSKSELNRICKKGGVELESFPARTLPFSFLGHNHPYTDSRISSNEYRSPISRFTNFPTSQFTNLPISQFTDPPNLFREDSTLIRIRRANL
jgi:hypothetical protein